MNSLCLLCPLYSFDLLLSFPRFSRENQCINNAGLSKQCMNVKMVVGLKCQNTAGMSKFCRYILSKWRRFAKGLQQIAKEFRRNKCLQQAKQAKRVIKISVNH